MDIWCFEMKLFISEWITAGGASVFLPTASFPPTAAKLGPEASILCLHVRKLQMWTPTVPLLRFQPWSSTNCWENTSSRDPKAGVLYESHVCHFVQFEPLRAHISSYTKSTFWDPTEGLREICDVKLWDKFRAVYLNIEVKCRFQG